MECRGRVLFIFLGLAAQLDGYVFQGIQDGDVDAVAHKRVAREAAQSSQVPEKDSQPEEAEKPRAHSRRHLRQDARPYSYTMSQNGPYYVRERNILPTHSRVLFCGHDAHCVAATRPSPAADNKVLAFGLDTGAPAESKNGIIQAISEAFGGILERPHVRSRGKSYKASDENIKKPIALELKSESLLQSLEKFLSSPKVKKIANDLARKAAVIYRAIEKEL